MNGPYFPDQKSAACGCYYPDVVHIRNLLEESEHILFCVNHGSVTAPLEKNCDRDEIVSNIPPESWRECERERLHRSHPLTHEDLDRLKKQYSIEEITAIRIFLCPLVKTARTYLVNIFVRARLMKEEKRMPFNKLMELLAEEYRTVWSKNSKRQGDPDDIVDGRGLANTRSFFAIYKELGLKVKGLY